MVDEAQDLGTMSRIEGVLTAVGPVAGKTVVDIGCGEGEVAKAFAGAGATVLGFDPFIPETDWVEQGEGRYRLHHARADKLPLDDGTADVALFVFSLHHVPQESMPAALAEARRVLKPGGKLVVAEPVAAGPSQYVMEPYHDETQVRANALAAITDHAAPAFASARVLIHHETRTYPDFDAYVRQAISSMRYNGYSEDDVVNDTVRGRFGEMAAVHGERFAQPVRINVFA